MKLTSNHFNIIIVQKSCSPNRYNYLEPNECFNTGFGDKGCAAVDYHPIAVSAIEIPLAVEVSVQWFAIDS